MAEAETQTPPLSLEATEHNVEQRPLSEEEEDDDDEGSLPQVVPVDSPRFAVTDREGYLAYLDEHGYCVIASVADEAAVARAKDLLWDFLERGDPDGRHHGDPPADEADGLDERGGGCGLRRDDPSTWGDDTWRERVSLPHAGIINHGGIGQSEFMWYLRTLPNVKPVFASLWGTDRLLTSFDGANVFRPWGTHPERKTRGGWYHIDQGKTKPRKCCVQGLITLMDATPESGGLVVIPQSHREHAGVVARNGSFSYGDFISLSLREPLLSQGAAALVRAKAGDMILWDSRTVHCNSPGLVDADVGPQNELLRMVGYVCMTPARWATYDVLARRRAAFAAKQTTSHWPHEFVPAGDGLVDAGGVTVHSGVVPCERADRVQALAAAPQDVRALVDGGYSGSWWADTCLIS